MEYPDLIDYIDLASGQLDVFNYAHSLLEFDDRKREFPDIMNENQIGCRGSGLKTITFQSDYCMEKRKFYSASVIHTLSVL
jgi:hypothetical protein